MAEKEEKEKRCTKGGTHGENCRRSGHTRGQSKMVNASLEGMSLSAFLYALVVVPFIQAVVFGGVGVGLMDGLWAQSKRTNIA